ncbi:probable protein phosphatase 2C 27 isoform X2 [Cryptomeria japonica]|nr:probable protein phosphatase 2C 27 isoform X2 [Cryptomeria japonica]
MENSSLENGKAQFVPTIRSGSWTDIGHRKCMEDEHICVDDLSKHLGLLFEGPQPYAFYGVFDGHCGAGAAIFVRNNLLRLVLEDVDFLQMVRKDGDFFIAAEKAVKNAFLLADLSLADDSDVDSSCGTTVLIALILGRSLLVANAGDCRAVLCRRGRAVALSRDHKPDLFSERLRIEALGGFVDDGYLNGELSVARALGDWDMKMPKGSPSPLSSEPEFQQVDLTEEDEFLIIGCDGIWDVISSEWAVNMVREELMQYNDPERCSRKLVQEALRQNTQDNLTVVVVSFSAEPPPVIERPPLRYHYIAAEGFRSLRGFLEAV